MYDEWLTADDRLTSFSKYRGKSLGRVKGAESPSAQGTQSSDEDLDIKERVPIRTDRPSLRETVTDGNHVTIVQAHNNGFSDSQEIPVSMDNMRPKGTEDQYITSPSGEALVANIEGKV